MTKGSVHPNLVMAAQADLAEGKIVRCGGHPFINKFRAR